MLSLPGSPRHSRLRPVGIVLTGLFAVIILLANQTPVKHRHTAPSSYPSNGFGGYQFYTSVNQISARWHVPTIASSSSGSASTWVGADDADFTHFIQLGVTEDQYGPGFPRYQAFWSDTAVGFHPISLGTVQAGDDVRAEMIHNSRGWLLRFTDYARHGIHVSKQIFYAAGVGFAHGDYLQEDPSPGSVAARDIPYPTMSLVTFRDLLVNNVRPTIHKSDGGVLLSNGPTILVPTVPSHNSFTFYQPHGYALQYLRDEKGLDSAVATFEARLTSWSSDSVATRKKYGSRFVDAHTQFSESLRRQTWPLSVRHDIQLLIKSNRTQIGELKTWVQSGAGALDSSLMAANSQNQQTRDNADQVRYDLGLPPTE